MSSPQQSSDAGLDPYRLPRHTLPIRYRLELAPDIEAATFAGTVTIDVDTVEAADRLVLNAIELEIAGCKVDGAEAPFSLDVDTERLLIAPPSGVAVGDHSIEIAFTGVLNDQLHGWYRSTYQADGNEYVIATSQMQSTDCRRAFPCWDEPEFKAIFEVALVVEAGLLAISNGAEISRTAMPNGTHELVEFAPTISMSTYLIAMVVGPLEATQWVDVDGVPLRVVHVPGKGDLADFGIEIGSFALRWFQSYYGIPYPSDKVELVALPDFAAGAMENLGCITFRESLLLVNPQTATQQELQNVTDVVSHELAHMWFGDLVTMKWWNGIWLNEAFATFMELAAADAFRPEWERWVTFGLERSVAFETDSLESTRPVEFKVESPADAEGMFDVLTYQKGGALLRMLEQHLGPEAFRSGVSAYLRTHAYANTDTSDLWDAIETTTGQPVRRIMDSWIWQPGFPLVDASLDAEGGLVLAQRRFSFHPELVDDTLWSIPIEIRAGTAIHKVVLEDRSMRLDIDGTTETVVVNARGNGFFRVAYSADLRDRFDRRAIEALDTLERYSLIDDMWAAVIAGASSASEFLEFAQRFSDERNYGVWQRIAMALRTLRRLVDDGPAADAFGTRVRAIAQPALARLGEPRESESDLEASLRGLLAELLAVVGDDRDAQARAREYYDQWERDPAGVDPELAAASTRIIAATGGEQDYERFTARALDPSNPQAQLRHLNALAEFDDADLAHRTCELAMSNQVKTQNAPFLLNLCIANRKQGAVAWEFVKDHWSEANDRFPRNTIVRMVSSVRLLDEPQQAADCAEFFAAHPIEQAVKTLDQVLERQRVNVALRAREHDALNTSLTDTGEPA